MCVVSMCVGVGECLDASVASVCLDASELVSECMYVYVASVCVRHIHS